MAKRLSARCCGLSLHGTLRPAKYPELDARVSREGRRGRDSGRRNRRLIRRL